MKIAWFTPFGNKSAIGNYSNVIVSELQNHAEVTIFADGMDGIKDAWDSRKKMVVLSQTPASGLDAMLPSYDICVYNLGDYLPFHRAIYETSQRHPGMCILHDQVMHHFFHGYLLEYKRCPRQYIEELKFSHGQKGMEIAEKYLQGELSELFSSALLLEYNMARSALKGAYGAVVHSVGTRNVLAPVVGVPIAHIPFPAPPIEKAFANRKEPARAVNKSYFLIYGVINPNKLVNEVIAEIASRQDLRQSVVLDIVGLAAPEYQSKLATTIAACQLHGVVHLHGYQADAILHGYMARADAIINLRNPHMGESSWSLLESTYLGKPVIVWKHGCYDEFPDDAVIKVSSLPQLSDAMARLISHPDWRRETGQKAYAYARRAFSTPEYCRRLLECITEMRYDRPLYDLLHFVTDILWELGVKDGSSPSFDKMADEISAISGAYRDGTL